jgi:hypothetical protein
VAQAQLNDIRLQQDIAVLLAIVLEYLPLSPSWKFYFERKVLRYRIRERAKENENDGDRARARERTINISLKVK